MLTQGNNNATAVGLIGIIAVTSDALNQKTKNIRLAALIATRDNIRTSLNTFKTVPLK